MKFSVNFPNKMKIQGMTMEGYNPLAFVQRRSDNAMGRQQIIIYFLGAILGVVGMALHLSSVVGADKSVLVFLSFVFIAGDIIPFFLWLANRIRLTVAFSASCIIIQLVQSAKIVYITTSLPSGFHYLVILNGIVSLLMMTLLSMSYIRLGSIIVGLLNAFSILFSALWLGDNQVWQLFVISILYAVFLLFLTDIMYRNVKHLQDENSAFHKDERTLLQVLRLNRKEIAAYIEMCRTDILHDKDADRLFSMLSERSQRNVINAVERKKALEASRKADLRVLFPDFTLMELEVARLILQDKKLKQIMLLTGKNESNISSVRSHIRKKMGLSPTDDLRLALLDKVEGKEVRKS